MQQKSQEKLPMFSIILFCLEKAIRDESFLLSKEGDAILPLFPCLLCALCLNFLLAFTARLQMDKLSKANSFQFILKRINKQRFRCLLQLAIQRLPSATR